MFYLGQLQATGSLPVSNQVTGASGALPFRIRANQRIYLTADTAGMQWAMGGATGFIATGLQAMPLAGPNVQNGPFYPAGENTTISVVSTVGGVVRVFAGPRA